MSARIAAAPDLASALAKAGSMTPELRAALIDSIHILEQWIAIAKSDQGTLGTRMHINRLKKLLTADDSQVAENRREVPL